MTQPIRKILIANRGEIACRVIDTARRLGIKTVAVFSDADALALHVERADEAVYIGPAAASESYLVADKLIEACRQTGADAVHPGYGFLSENPDFADALARAGVRFIGPSAAAMRAMALKGAAKALMQDAGVPVVPGYHGDDQSDAVLIEAAKKIGFPVLIKAVAGGGGKGMRMVFEESALEAAIQSARREGENSFKNGKLLIEKYIEKPRHIEVQVFGDSYGHAVHLWERDCSLQRRHQKVVEEAPAPGMTAEMRRQMGDAAVKAAEAIGYAGAGTVEFIVDVAKGLEGAPFYFMEMNTRLQVEHPVSELISGQDLVAWQIRVAEGEVLPLSQDEIDATVAGHAVEVRLYAEDPFRDFAPQTGTITAFDYDIADIPGTRVDTGVRPAGDTVTVHYDPMIAKLIAFGDDREMAITRLISLLEATPVSGLVTNRAFLLRALAHPDFRSGDIDTGFIARFADTLLAPSSFTRRDYALAAGLIVLDRQAHTAPTDLWGAGDSFRLNLPASDTIRFATDDDDLMTCQVILTAGGVQVAAEDQVFIITDMGPGMPRRLMLDGEVIKVRSEALHSDHPTLHIGSRALTFTRHRSTSLAAGEADGPGTLTAPMPGKILDVLVEDGADVAKGAPLLVMEAMKMEQTLTAPRAGIVTGLALKAGDLVGDGATLLSIQDPEHEA